MESRLANLSKWREKFTAQNVILVGCILLVSYLVLIPLLMLPILCHLAPYDRI